MNKKSDLKIIYRKISELIPAEYNPRLMTTKDRKGIEESLNTFGFVNPVIVNQHPERKDVIVGGHMRVQILKDKRKTHVPCVYVHLEKEKEMELNVRLNKNTGEWDYEILANIFDVNHLIKWGFMKEELLGDWDPNIGNSIDDLVPMNILANGVITIKCDKKDYDEINTFLNSILKDTSFTGVKIE